MDSFDRRILKALRDKQPKTFQEILSRVDFTHNTSTNYWIEAWWKDINSLRMARGGQYTSTTSLRI